MLISIRHLTRYRYAQAVAYSIQSLRLTPAAFRGQRVVDWRVAVAGGGTPLQLEDGFGNALTLVTVTRRHDELVIEAAGSVETEDRNGVVDGLARIVPPRVFLRETPATRADQAIRELAAGVAGKDGLDKLHALLAAVRDRVDYVPGATASTTSAAEALAAAKGVCQDHAHIFIAAARSLDIPARYVTGYLVLADAGAADAHHAWAEAWVEGLGWVGFDAANRICPTERYVRLACGLDAATAAPVIGSRRGGEAEALSVSVEVQQQSVQQ